MHSINWESEISQLSGNQAYKVMRDYFNDYARDIAKYTMSHHVTTIEEQLEHAANVGRLEIIERLINLPETIKDILIVEKIKEDIVNESVPEDDHND